MPLYCSRQAFEALSGLTFPASKEQILRYVAAHGTGAMEPVFVAFNRLSPDVLYPNIDAVCEGVSLSCSLEVHQCLEKAPFPATKEQLLAYAGVSGASAAVLQALQHLVEGFTYADIGQVCAQTTTYDP